MRLFKHIKERITFLCEPTRTLKEALLTPFEHHVSTYISLLIITGLLAGLFNFLLRVGNAYVLDIFFNATINYDYMLNYAAGFAVSSLFFVLFAGTAITFLLSIILKPFVRIKKFTRLLTILFYAATPLLLFGWLTFLAPALIIWSLFLLIAGLQLKNDIETKTIDQRD